MAFMSMVRPRREVMRPECGTYACFAGWYMMGRELARGSVEEVTFCEEGSDDSYVRFRIDGMLRDLHYEGGVLRLATDLGFDEGSELTEWAAHNPDLWGNRHGGRDVLDALRVRRRRRRGRAFPRVDIRRAPPRRRRACAQVGG